MERRLRCPNACFELAEPRGSAVLKAGFFRRKDDGQRIQRYLCRHCRRYFSSATFSPAFAQHKRRINNVVRNLLCAKVSHRQIARLVKINLKTVARKVDYLGQLSEAYLNSLDFKNLLHVQFDEMQSSIHTKCKPVAIPMVVCAKTYKILALDVASMPAQHPLKEIALAKYGPRADDRAEAIHGVLTKVAPMLARGAQITTDAAPRYPAPIMRLLPGVGHMVFRSRKARIGGQGELKKIGFDPLFPFNHTAAMVRDHVSSLVRKTWCNSKRMDRLRSHLMIYAEYHNTVLKAA